MRSHGAGFALGLVCVSATALAAPCGPCTADVDDGTRTGTLDGGVTIEDLLYFLESFSEGLVWICDWYRCLDPSG